MTNTDDLYDNFYDSELIVEFLQGVLPGDLHLKIQAQIEASEVFRSYVEGVQINFEKSGKNFEKMEIDIATKKARAWEKLKKKLPQKTTFKEKIIYTYEQLQDYFRPNPQLELALQPTRGTNTLQAQITVDDTAGAVALHLGKKNKQIIDLQLLDNKIQPIQKHEIPVDSENFTLSIVSLRPGIYYVKLKLKGLRPRVLSFYIREDLKPE